MTFTPPPESIVLETEHWRVNHRVDSLLPGYLIVESRDPAADQLWKAPPAALAELGGVLARCSHALDTELGAQRVYVMRLGHTRGPSVHFHVIPIYGWVEEAFIEGRGHAGPEFDGADLTLFVMRTYCERVGTPESGDVSIAEAVETLRNALSRTEPPRCGPDGAASTPVNRG